MVVKSALSGGMSLIVIFFCYSVEKRCFTWRYVFECYHCLFVFFMQQLELLMKAHGMNNNLTEEVQTMVQPDTFVVSQNVVKQEPRQLPCEQITSPISHSTLNFDDLMDESSPVVSDPMLSQQPLSNKMDDETMEYVL